MWEIGFGLGRSKLRFELQRTRQNRLDSVLGEGHKKSAIFVLKPKAKALDSSIVLWSPKRERRKKESFNNMIDEILNHIDKIIASFNLLTGEPWFWWGMGIILLYPFLLIVINEVTHRIKQDHSEVLAIILHTRNIVLPIFLLYLLLAKILILPESHLILKIIKSLFWILLIYFTLRVVNAILFSESFQFKERIPKLLVDFIRAFLVLFGIALVVSDVWDVELGKLLAALGMGSLVLGLALQDVLGGLFSGLGLLSSRPFNVGDWIRIGEMEGQVKSIDWRAVSLQTEDNSLVTIPNAIITKREFKNFSKPTPLHRISIFVEFSLEYPPNQVIDILLKTISNIAGILTHPKPEVCLSSYNYFRKLANYEIRYFIESYDKKNKVSNLLMSQIWYLSQRENISLNKQSNSPLPILSTASEQAFEIATRLKKLNVFDVHEEDLLQLAHNATFKIYGIQEFVLTENQPSTLFYIVAEGIAEQRNQVTHSQHKKTVTFRLTPGDFFGFSGMVGNENHGESVVALTDLTVIAIQIEELRKILQRNPQLADCLESIVRARSALGMKIQ
jgi:small-conductance mechanosensitive channel